jgi:filamentous hemagglutinin
MLGDKDISQRVIQVVTQDSKYAKADSENFMPIESSDYYKAADTKTKNALKGKGLLVSINPVAIDKTNATYQNFTNGMLNHEALAIKNGIDQTGSDIVTINYNPTHGLFGDGLESGIDKAGLGTTGVAKQTGEFIYDVTTSRAKEGSNFAAHSQGNLLTKSGIEYRKSHGGFKDRSYFIDLALPTTKQQERAVPTFAGYGSPVNTEEMKKIVNSNKSGDKQFNFDGMYTKKNDFVGEFLGNNKGENLSNPNRSIIDTIKDGGLLFDLGGESPHSTYDCQSNPNAHCGKREW